MVTDSDEAMKLFASTAGLSRNRYTHTYTPCR
jgi:hypothetical protein